MQQTIQSADLHAQLPPREAPGPRRWPLLGAPAALGAASDLLGFYEGQWRRYGDTFRVPLPGTNMFVVAHPDAIKHVLWTHRDNYVKGNTYNGARRIMGDSLLTLEGQAWKDRRALEQPAFHRRSIERLSQHMITSGARFFDAWLARAGAGRLRVDAHREMVKLTLDVVARALFGQAMAGHSVSYETLSEALEIVSQGANQIVLPAWVPTARNRRLRRTLAALDRIMYDFIETAQAQGETDSLLSMLVHARDEHGAPLPRRVIRDEVMTMFIAGHETTALALTWLFTLLDGRPEIVARMRAEVDAVLGDRDPSIDDVPKLRYLRQVVDETLRLRPPAPLLARNAVADDSIGGYKVHAGDIVMPFVWGCQRHPQFWENPLYFDPERFDPDNASKRHSYVYLPFSAGPRSCIGNMFSLVESVLLLAQLLRRFDLEVEPCADVKPIALATARPSKPVYVTLGRRTTHTGSLATATLPAP